MDTLKEGIGKRAAGAVPKTFVAIAEGTCVRNLRSLARRPAKHDKLRWVAHGERTEDHRVDNGKDRRVGSDAERESENCNCREPRIAAELAQAVAEVLQEFFDESNASGIANLLFDLLNPAQLNQCLPPSFFG